MGTSPKGRGNKLWKRRVSKVVKKKKISYKGKERDSNGP